MKYKVTFKNMYSGQSTVINAISHRHALEKAQREAGMHWKHFPIVLIEEVGQRE